MVGLGNCFAKLFLEAFMSDFVLYMVVYTDSYSGCGTSLETILRDTLGLILRSCAYVIFLTTVSSSESEGLES
jgi:hypothetical protein